MSAAFFPVIVPKSLTSNNIKDKIGLLMGLAHLLLLLFYGALALAFFFPKKIVKMLVF
jgi:hypothetical protein